jgi:hypothetical protein
VHSWDLVRSLTLAQLKESQLPKSRGWKVLKGSLGVARAGLAGPREQEQVVSPGGNEEGRWSKLKRTMSLSPGSAARGFLGGAGDDERKPVVVIGAYGGESRLDMIRRVMSLKPGNQRNLKVEEQGETSPSTTSGCTRSASITSQGGSQSFKRVDFTPDTVVPPRETGGRLARAFRRVLSIVKVRRALPCSRLLTHGTSLI